MVNSRKELVNWFNQIGIEIDRIEDLGKGSAICELLSQIHPTFPSSFIKKPSNEYEYLKNMKIIQSFFISNRIELYFPVDKLIKCKLQDNLEVAQRLYKYYVKKSIGKDSREEKSMNSKEEKSMNSKEEKSMNSKEEKSMNSKEEKSITGCMNSVQPFSKPQLIDREASRLEIIENLNKEKNKHQEEEQRKVEALEEENKRLKEKIGLQEVEVLKYKGLLGELGSVKEILKALEENRDFYFKKLVEIEKYLEACEEVPEEVKKVLFEILYKKNE